MARKKKTFIFHAGKDFNAIRYIFFFLYVLGKIRYFIQDARFEFDNKKKNLNFYFKALQCRRMNYLHTFLRLTRIMINRGDTLIYCFKLRTNIKRVICITRRFQNNR